MSNFHPLEVKTAVYLSFTLYVYTECNYSKENIRKLKSDQIHLHYENSDQCWVEVTDNTKSMLGRGRRYQGVI